MLVTTAGVHHKDDPPFDADGDLSFRTIAGDAAIEDLRVTDKHYDHGCVDADINTVFPLGRLRELAAPAAGGGPRIGAVASTHFSTGFAAALRQYKEQTAPAVAEQAALLRPDCVVLTGG
jgi:D-proline reductase (dithiol) PrdB